MNNKVKYKLMLIILGILVILFLLIDVYKRQSLFLAVLRKIILLIPLIYIVPNFVDDKAMGVFLAEPIADGIAVLTTGILFLRMFSKLKKQMAD